MQIPEGIVITETHQKLNNFEDQYQFILENTNDLIFILNQNFDIEYINENVIKESLGYLKEDLIGKSPLELIHWKDQKIANNIFNGNLQENNNIVKLRIKDQNNNYFQYEFKRKIFIDQKGDLKILIISRKIEKLEDLEERLNEQRLKESEEKFRTIAEQWLMGICIIQDNCVKYLNQQLADLLGYTTDEIISWQPGEFFKTIHPDDRPMVLEQAQMKNDELDSGIRNYIARGVHKSGRIIWVEVWFKSIEYESRRAFLNTFIDITDKKIAEEKLKESEERYRLITENANDVISIFDENFNLEYINETQYRLSGFSKEEMINKTPIEFLHPEDVKRGAKVFKDLLKTGVGIGEFRMRCKDGSYIWIEVNGKIFLDQNGKKKVILLSRDINERKSVEQKLKESEEKFRTITEQSVVGIGIIQDNLAKFVNQKFADIFGYSIEETLNWKPGEFIKTVHPGDRDFVIRQSKKKQYGSSDYLKNYQFRGLKKNSEVIWIDNFTKTISYEGRPAALNTFVDITEKLIYEQKLIESEKKYRHLFDNSPFFIGLVDMNGNLIDCNMTINEFMSIHNKENVVGKSFREILSLNENNKYLIPIFSNFFIEAIKSKKVEPYEFELFRSKDDSLWLRIEGSLIELNNKKVLQFIIQDITERKQAEIALQQAANHWSTTFNAMSDSVILLDQDNRIVQCNKATLEILGKSNYHEIIGRPCWEVVHGTSEPVDWCPVMHMKRSGHTETSIAQIGDMWVYISADPILDNKSHIIGAVHVISDITERKLAEEKLKQSEERYRLITENANDMISITNNESILEYVNESVHKKYLGYSKDELIGKNLVNNIHPDDAQNIIDFAEELREKGESMTEVRFRRKDRKYVWLQMKGKSFVDIDGKEKMLGVSRDITARKKIEQKLKESEKRYRLITDNSKEAVFIMDMNFKQTFASPATYEMLGYTPEELEGLSIQKTTTLASIRVVAEIYKEELAIEKQDDKDLNRSRRFEIQQIHKNGKIIDVEMSTTFLRDDDNNAIGIIGLSRDISARKKAERKLKESEERYRFLFEKSPFSIILINSKGNIEDCNSKVEDFGYLREELIGKKYARLNIIRQKFIPILLERFRKILKGEILPPIDVEFIKKDGSTFWGSINSSLITIAGTIYIQVLIEDSTNRIEAEQRLSASEERLRLITENANDVIWTSDMNLNFTYISPTCIKILGYTDKESINLRFQKFTTPDSIKILLEAFKEEFELEKRGTGDKDRVRNIEIQQIHKNGSIVDIELILTWLRDENEKAIGIIGITRDISERKEAERKLKESEERFRLISENANDVIWTTDMSLNLTYVSPSTQNASGWSVEEILNMKLDQYHTPASFKFLVDQFKEELKIERRKDKDLNRIRVFEVEQIHKNGSIINKEIVITFLRDERQKAIGLVGVTRDITEKKEAEKKIKESEKKYRKAYKRANYYKDLFAHDINNILQTINSSAELIKYYLSDSEKIKDVNAISLIINKQVMRGAKLVTNVHTLSNLEEGDIPIEPIEINNLLKNSIEFVKNVYTDKNIDVYIDSFNEDITVKANFLVQEAFDNLLNNAIKYNSNENVEISIRISKILMEEINYIKMEFIDNGIGVTDERKNLIFKRYEREHKGGKGMGVGLSLIKKIIKKYKGKIWVEDKVIGDYSKGSNFIILIPEANKAD